MSIEVYRDKLNSMNPDAVYEEFWLLLKDSMLNYRAPNDHPIMTQLTEYSKRLNEIQKDGLEEAMKTGETDIGGASTASTAWVQEIHDLIEEYLANLIRLYNQLDFDNFSGTYLHHQSILLTNVKLWRKIDQERGRGCSSKLSLLEQALKHLPKTVDLAGHVSYEQTLEDLAVNLSLLAAGNKSEGLLAYLAAEHPEQLHYAIKAFYRITLPCGIKGGCKIAKFL